MNEQATFFEKTHGRWEEIFNEFINDERFAVALSRPGKHCPSPFNAESKRDGFRLDKDFNTKGGLGYETSGTMSGVSMVAYMTGLNNTQAASQIHKFCDGNAIDVIAIRTEIKQHQEKQNNKDLHKLEFNRQLISKILKQPTDNSFRDKYLANRGLAKAIPLLNEDVRSIPELYYDKNNSLPAMVAVVRNEDNKIAFLHRTYLDKDGNKADVEIVKKVTGKTREDAYQRPFFAQVNNPKNPNSDAVHICEGVETALAVTLLSQNTDKVVSAINADGLTKFAPSKDIKQVYIWADNDKKGIDSANKLQEKLAGKVKAQVITPRKQGHDFLDEWNQQKNQTVYKAKIIQKPKQLSR